MISSQMNPKILRFLKLMTFNDVDLNLADEAIDQIIDWIDKDSNPRAYGLRRLLLFRTIK